MSKKLTPEKMLLRVLRVAEILVKATDLKPEDSPENQSVPNEASKMQSSSVENTKQ